MMISPGFLIVSGMVPLSLPSKMAAMFPTRVTMVLPGVSFQQIPMIFGILLGNLLLTVPRDLGN